MVNPNLSNPLLVFPKNFRGLFSRHCKPWYMVPIPRAATLSQGCTGGEQIGYLGCVSVAGATQVGLAARLHPKKNGHALVNVVPPLMGVTVSRLTRHTSRNM
jgi:hypothetical protein